MTSGHGEMRLSVDIPSRQEGHVHRAGTPVVIVERLGRELALVEVRVPDESLEGGAWYETLEVRPSELEGLP